MSIKSVQQSVDVETCDYCDESMDKYDEHDGMFHEPNKASIVSGYISHPTSNRSVNKFYFIWNRREERKQTIRYDFHTRCFDKLMKQLPKLKEKI